MSIGPVMIQNAAIATYTQSQSSHYGCAVPSLGLQEIMFNNVKIIC